MLRKLWEPSPLLIKKSNLYKFEIFLNKNINYKVSKNYNQLYKWTIKNIPSFWSHLWKYLEIVGDRNDKFKFSKNFIQSKFFIGSKLNFAENIFSKKDNSKAITFISENGYREEKNWNELYKNTSKIIKFFKYNKIKERDRIRLKL